MCIFVFVCVLTFVAVEKTETPVPAVQNVSDLSCVGMIFTKNESKGETNVIEVPPSFTYN